MKDGEPKMHNDLNEHPERHAEALMIGGVALLLIMVVLLSGTGFQVPSFSLPDTSPSMTGAVVADASASSSHLSPNISLVMQIVGWLLIVVVLGVALTGFFRSEDISQNVHRTRLLGFFDKSPLTKTYEHPFLRHLKVNAAHKDHLMRTNVALLENIQELLNESNKEAPENYEKLASGRIDRYFAALDVTLKNKWGKGLVDTVAHLQKAEHDAQHSAWFEMFEKDLAKKAGYSIAHEVDEILTMLNNSDPLEENIKKAIKELLAHQPAGDGLKEHDSRLLNQRAHLREKAEKLCAQTILNSEYSLNVIKTVYEKGVQQLELIQRTKSDEARKRDRENNVNSSDPEFYLKGLFGKDITKYEFNSDRHYLLNDIEKDQLEGYAREIGAAHLRHISAMPGNRELFDFYKNDDQIITYICHLAFLIVLYKALSDLFEAQKKMLGKKGTEQNSLEIATTPNKLSTLGGLLGDITKKDSLAYKKNILLHQEQNVYKNLFHNSDFFEKHLAAEFKS